MIKRGNKLFAGSRMILPEHRRGLEKLKHRLDLDYHKPILDEQYLLELNELIIEAIRYNKTIILTIDNDICNQMIAAKPIQFKDDKLFVLTEQGKQSIKLDRIIEVRCF